MTSAPPSSAEPLLAILREGSGHPALISPDDGTAISHGELASAVLRLAGQLAGLGVAPGQRIAMVLPNGPEVVELLLAVAAVGATAAPLNPGYTRAEYEFYLDDLDPGLVLIQAGRGAEARAAAAGGPSWTWPASRRAPPLLSVAGRPATGEAPFAAGSADDVALLLHTSGTTRRPKQVPLRQRNVMASARAIAAHYALTGDDISYCAMPLFHVHGLIASALAQLGAGGSVVTPRRLTPRRYWRQLTELGVTWVSASPTIHAELIGPGGEPAPAIRFIRSCSSALSPALLAELARRYQAPVLEAYGMTEASHQMTANPLPPRRGPGGHGRHPGRCGGPDRRQGGPGCAGRGDRRGSGPRPRR